MIPKKPVTDPIGDGKRTHDFMLLPAMRAFLNLIRIKRAGTYTGYRADIDGLRAIAIILVVGFHYAPKRLAAGFIGVDIFFVISGYLITGIILSQMADGRFRLANFFSRRILRLFPALIAMLVVLSAFGWFYFTASEFKVLGKHIAGGAFYVSNFVLWLEAGYFDDSAITKPMLHLWSLAIEEQFYVFWPLFLLVFARTMPLAIVPVVVVAGLSFWMNIHFSESRTNVAFYMPFTRAWELFIGGMLAHWQKYPPGRSGIAKALPESSVAFALQAAPYLGVALIISALLLIDEKSVWPGYNALLPVLGCLLLIAGRPTGWINRYLLANPALVWLGLISYPLYLWHWMLLSVVATLQSEFPSKNARFVLLGISIVLAYATYRLIEVPIRKHARPATVGVLLAAMTLIGAFGAYVFFGNGLPDRYGPASQAFAAYEKKLASFEFPFGAYPTVPCKETFPYGGWCVSARPGPMDVALVGDSHAHHFFPGLAALFLERGSNMVLLGSGGCPPFVDIASRAKDGADWCIDSNAVIKAIARNDAIKTVLLAANWHLYAVGNRFADREFGPYWNLEATDGSSSHEPAPRAEIFANQLRKTIRLLTEAGKRVYLIKQTPEPDMNPKICFQRPKAFKMPPDCQLDRSRVEAYLKEYEAILDPVLAEFGNVTILDPVAPLCGDRHCPVIMDGSPLYRDTVHLSLFGSHFVARRLMENVR